VPYRHPEKPTAPFGQASPKISRDPETLFGELNQPVASTSRNLDRSVRASVGNHNGFKPAIILPLQRGKGAPQVAFLIMGRDDHRNSDCRRKFGRRLLFSQKHRQGQLCGFAEDREGLLHKEFSYFHLKKIPEASPPCYWGLVLVLKPYKSVDAV
jgi:hypothetical protein